MDNFEGNQQAYMLLDHYSKSKQEVMYFLGCPLLYKFWA